VYNLFSNIQVSFVVVVVVDQLPNMCLIAFECSLRVSQL
jgi:hypothetical protein